MICYEFPKEVVVYKADMLPRTDSTVEDPGTYKYEYSMDGVNWEDITDTITGNPGVWNVTNFAKPVLAKYIRLFVFNTLQPANRVDILEIQYYGR